MRPARLSRRLAPRALLLLLGTTIGVGVAEGFARLTYSEPWHQRLMEDQAESERLRYRRNSLRLRDREIAYPKPPDEKRILLLGDSFTFGLGVADEEETFPARLEGRLTAQAGRFGAQRVDVLNGGIPASLTDKWLSLWRRLRERYRPDAVVVVFFLRDGTRTASIPEFFGRIRDEITERNRDSRLYRWSHLYRMLRDRLDRQEISRSYTEEFQRAYFGNERERREWELAKKRLLEIRDEARRDGVAVGFVVFPILVDLDESYPFQAICDELERWAREAGFATHSLLPAYLGRSGPELWVSSYDQHPNAEGHAIAAESLEPFLAELLTSGGRRTGGG